MALAFFMYGLLVNPDTEAPVTEENGMESAAREPPLELLVRRTRGPQPWRRVFHATNGVLIAIVVTWWPLAPELLALALWTICGLLVFGDLMRLRLDAANRLFFRFLRPLASPREADGIASSTWYMLGITLAVTFASVPAAVSGVLVMALSDPAASYFGRRWGRKPFLGGSVEGSLLFLLVTLAVLAPRHGWSIALAVALPVTLLERRSWPLDDNLTVPVATAALVGMLGG